MATLASSVPGPRSQMFWERRADKAARIDSWKWIDSARGSGLFDLSEDIAEQHDLSEKYPKKLLEMQQAFADWKGRMDAAEPRGPFRDY